MKRIAEAIVWANINSNRRPRIEDYEAYLRAFPKGVFCEDARHEIEKIKSSNLYSLKAAAKRFFGLLKYAWGIVVVVAGVPTIIFAYDEGVFKPASQLLQRHIFNRYPNMVEISCEALPPNLGAANKCGQMELGYSDDWETEKRYTEKKELSFENKKYPENDSEDVYFQIATHELTKDQFARYQKSLNPDVKYSPLSEGSEPARLTWMEANNYVGWLNKIYKDEYIYSIPTEEQWEWICRAGGFRTMFTYTSEPREQPERHLSSYAVYKSERPLSVGSKLPNDFRLYDIHGNLSEWVFSSSWQQDCERESDDSNSCKPYISRGGNYSNNAIDTQCQRRSPQLATDARIGLRVVRVKAY